jgi:hypothetical protein
MLPRWHLYYRTTWWWNYLIPSQMTIFQDGSQKICLLITLRVFNIEELLNRNLISFVLIFCIFLSFFHFDSLPNGDWGDKCPYPLLHPQTWTPNHPVLFLIPEILCLCLQSGLINLSSFHHPQLSTALQPQGLLCALTENSSGPSSSLERLSRHCTIHWPILAQYSSTFTSTTAQQKHNSSRALKNK